MAMTAHDRLTRRRLPPFLVLAFSLAYRSCRRFACLPSAQVAREVREETRVEATLDGVATMRHSHGRRFSQGDLYVVIRLRATSEAITIDPAELRAARWMSRAEIDKLKEGPEDAASLDGKVSTANYEMIQSALDGELIEGVTVPNSKGVGTMVYRARPRAAWVDMPCD